MCRAVKGVTPSKQTVTVNFAGTRKDLQLQGTEEAKGIKNPNALEGNTTAVSIDIPVSRFYTRLNAKHCNPRICRLAPWPPHIKLTWAGQKRESRQGQRGAIKSLEAELLGDGDDGERWSLNGNMRGSRDVREITAWQQPNPCTCVAPIPACDQHVSCKHVHTHTHVLLQLKLHQTVIFNAATLLGPTDY